MTAVLVAQYGAQQAPASPKPVRLATASALAANTYSASALTLTANANGAMATVDNVAPAAGDRILVKDESTASHNGIYVVTSLGGAGPYILTRADDASASAHFTAGEFVAVSEGDLNADKLFELTTDGAITLDSSSLTFAPASRGLVDTFGMADTGTLFLSVTAGGGGSADDVTVFNANCPFKIRILDSRFHCTAGNSAGRTVTMRDTAGGAGNALSDAFACTSTGLQRNAGVASNTVAKSGSIFLRRSDSGVAGQLQIDYVRTA